MESTTNINTEIKIPWFILICFLMISMALNFIVPSLRTTVVIIVGISSVYWLMKEEMNWIYLSVLIIPVEAIQGGMKNEIHVLKTVFMIGFILQWFIRRWLSGTKVLKSELNKLFSLSSVEIVFLILGVYIAIHVSITSMMTGLQGLRTGARIIIYLSAFTLFMRSILDSRQKINAVLKWVIVYAILHTGICLAQFLGNYLFTYEVGLLEKYNGFITNGITRPHGLMSEPMPSADILFLPFFLSFSYGIYYWQIQRKTIFLGLAVLFLGGIGITFSRGGWVSILVGIFVSMLIFLPSYFKGMIKVFLTSAATFILIIVMSTQINPDFDKKLKEFINFKEKSIKTEFAYNDEIDDRKNIIITSLMVVQKNMFGVGLRNYKTAVEKILKTEYRWSTSMNSYVDITVELGIPGLILFLISIILLLYESFKRTRFIKDPVHVIVISGIVCAYVSALVQLNFFYYWKEYQFWFLTGLLISIVRLADDNAIIQINKNTEKR